MGISESCLIPNFPTRLRPRDRALHSPRSPLEAFGNASKNALPYS